MHYFEFKILCCIYICRDRVVKAPYDTISQGSAASSNMGAFYHGDTLFDPAAAIAALQLGGGKKAAASAAFDTASLRSQDETIRYGLCVLFLYIE